MKYMVTLTSLFRLCCKINAFVEPSAQLDMAVDKYFAGRA
jgi:hypothetical protein